RRGVREFREAEVQNFHGAVVPDLDVRGLQIAMDDSLFVRGFEGVSDLPADGQRIVERDGTLSDAIRQRRALDQLHHQPVNETGVFDAVDVGDVRVIERREHLRLAAKPRKAVRVRCHSFREYLDGHVPIQLRVARPVHLAHSARAERGDHFVWTDTGARAELHCGGRLRLYRATEQATGPSAVLTRTSTLLILPGAR